MNLGLKKLIQGAEDVEAMKIVLAEEQKKLEVATLETNKMLSSLEVSSAEAKKEGDQVKRTLVEDGLFTRAGFYERRREGGVGVDV